MSGTKILTQEHIEFPSKMCVLDFWLQLAPVIFAGTKPVPIDIFLT